MEYARLGNTGMKVSRICLGCMGFGDAERWTHKWVLNEENSRKVCQSHLSMLGKGFLLYSNENKGSFPRTKAQDREEKDWKYAFFTNPNIAKVSDKAADSDPFGEGPLPAECKRADEVCDKDERIARTQCRRLVGNLKADPENLKELTTCYANAKNCYAFKNCYSEMWFKLN